MNERKIYFTAVEVAKILGVSKGHAYKLIQRMNTELSNQGYLVIAGKIPVRYFEERYYGFIA
jgi:transposase